MTSDTQGIKLDPSRVESGPTKDFFISMITRDIDLTGAIIELVDNCLDGLKRQKLPNYDDKRIKITFDENHFSISDNCGGINIDTAREYAFKFGKSQKEILRQRGIETTGVFGIGMKRALFKMGEYFLIKSQDPVSSFELQVDVPEWATKEEWNFSFSTYSENLKNPIESCGTDIHVTRLDKGIAANFIDTSYINSLRARLSGSAQHGVKITVNGSSVNIKGYELINDGNITPYKDEFSHADVEVMIVAGLAPETSPALAGWYVYCNNREIVSADKSSLTTWKDSKGEIGKRYHNDYASFRGYVCFTSKNPELLPWNTSKTNIDASRSVYQLAQRRMIVAYNAVIEQLKKIIKDIDRSIVFDSLKSLRKIKVDFSSLRQLPQKTDINYVNAFQEHIKRDPDTTTIKYSKPISQVEAVKKALKVRTNSDVGNKTFEYYVSMEEIK